MLDFTHIFHNKLLHIKNIKLLQLFQEQTAFKNIRPMLMGIKNGLNKSNKLERIYPYRH